MQLIHLGDLQWGRPGAGSRDEIRCSFTVTLSSPLPALASYDYYSITGVDGAGLSGDAFRMDGVTRTTLAVGSIRNFNGHGIVLTGGAHDNRITSGLGGITLKGSANNLVLGNWIGIRPELKFPSSTDGNIPHGIGLFDSPDNVIGELAGDGANENGGRGGSPQPVRHGGYRPCQ
ncbi:MAG TPA: hypothetical protein VMS21_01580 [Methylomirabilota bacterium]|nr:hypothetical protein [Methylomirabilota bacterium]